MTMCSEDKRKQDAVHPPADTADNRSLIMELCTVGKQVKQVHLV